VTNPEHPGLLRFVEGPADTMTLQVQVAERVMVTGLEHAFLGPSLSDSAPPSDGFLIRDVKEPDRPLLLGGWVSGGTGTYRNFCSGGRWVCATSTLPGFEGHILAVGRHRRSDESEGHREVVVPRTEPGRRRVVYGGGGESAHQRSPLPRRTASVSVADRAYCPWKRAGTVLLDLSDKERPKHVCTLSGISPGWQHHRSSPGCSAGWPKCRCDQQRGTARAECRTRRLCRHGGHLGRVRSDDHSCTSHNRAHRSPTASAASSARAVDSAHTTSTSGKARIASHPTTAMCTPAYFNAGLQIYNVGDPVH
jgi:hypothetical protein